MANTKSKSSAKRANQSLVRNALNKPIKTKMLTMIKNIVKNVELKDFEKANSYHSIAQKSIDKAVNKGIIHKKNGARKKSRITRLISSISK
jgi:small subunit ribosomal protein S20